MELAYHWPFFILKRDEMVVNEQIYCVGHNLRWSWGIDKTGDRSKYY